MRLLLHITFLLVSFSYAKAGFISHSPLVCQYLGNSIGRKTFYMVQQNSRHDSDNEEIVTLKIYYWFIFMAVHCFFFFFHTPYSSLYYFLNMKHRSSAPQKSNSHLVFRADTWKQYLSLAEASVWATYN